MCERLWKSERVFVRKLQFLKEKIYTCIEKCYTSKNSCVNLLTENGHVFIIGARFER